MFYTRKVGASHLFLYIVYYALCGYGLVISFHINACMQGELTSRLSSSWMYIAYTLLLFWFMQKGRKILFMSLVFVSLCWWIDKKGERYFRVWYMHIYLNMYVCLNLFSLTIGIKSIFCWYQELLLVSRATFF